MMNKEKLIEFKAGRTLITNRHGGMLYAVIELEDIGFDKNDHVIMGIIIYEGNPPPYVKRLLNEGYRVLHVFDEATYYFSVDGK